jgi:ribosomal protein S1
LAETGRHPLEWSAHFIREPIDMTPDPSPSKSSLDSEISAALDGINLQEIAGSGEAQRPAAQSTGGSGGGDRLHTGLIVGVSGDDVIVELGPRMQGVASIREFEEAPKVGESFQFTLRGRDEGLWLLSRRDAQAISSWQELQVGSNVKARVSGQNQGGLELKIGSNDAFMPASQVALNRVEDLAAFLGETMVCEVLEIDKRRKRVVLSRRAVLQHERSQSLADSAGSLQVGAVVTGKVTKVEAFGAFVDVGSGLEGLVHVSNMSRKRVDKPDEFVTKGQEVQVKILDIKDGGKRIGLGMKQLEPDPWEKLHETLSEGSTVEGKVTRLMDFGAFVEVSDGIEGLLHVSQISNDRLRKPGDAVKVDEVLTVRVQAIDFSAQRISLTRFDERGAIIGSEDAVDSSVINEVLGASTKNAPSGNSLGALLKKALEDKQG